MSRVTYVTLQPHSNTNPTSEYRVVNYWEWSLANMTGKSYRYTPFDSFTAAERYKDDRNEVMSRQCESQFYAEFPQEDTP